MTQLPTLNMVGWTVLQYELAYAGLRHVNDATLLLQNQPRALRAPGEYEPGADVIVQVGEDWCGPMIDDLIDSLRTIRFEKREDDERRVRLLVHYMTSHGPSGEPMADVLAMIVGWMSEKGKLAA